MNIAWFDETAHRRNYKNKIDGLPEALKTKRLRHWDAGWASASDFVVVEHIGQMAIKASRANLKPPLILRANAMELYKGSMSAINWPAVNRLVVHGEHLREYFLERWQLLPPDRITTIPLGIDTQKYKPHQNKQQNNKVAVLSEIHWRKGSHTIPDFLNKYPHFEIYHAGKVIDHDCKNYLDWKLRMVGVDGRYHYVGFESDVKKFLHDKSWLLHPSYTEGMPRAVGEAMACGVWPLIRYYRGAGQQWPIEYVFETLDDLQETIMNPNRTDPRSFILQNYSNEVVADRFKKEVLCAIPNIIS